MGPIQSGLVAFSAVVALINLDIIERGVERLSPAIRRADAPLREGTRIAAMIAPNDCIERVKRQGTVSLSKGVDRLGAPLLDNQHALALDRMPVLRLAALQLVTRMP